MWRAMLRVVGLGVLTLGGACGFAPEGLDLESGSAPSGAMAEAEGAAPAASPILRAHKVEAKRIAVGVLFAHKVHAKAGTVLTAGPPLSPAELEVQAGSQDVAMPELTVDVLYAHDVEAKVLMVRELHALDVKIGRGEGSDD